MSVRWRVTRAALALMAAMTLLGGCYDMGPMFGINVCDGPAHLGNLGCYIDRNGQSHTGRCRVQEFQGRNFYSFVRVAGDPLGCGG